MHDTDAQGNEFFKCDFCLSSWAENRPMVEGHRGSLICAPCLTLAYRLVILQKAGRNAPEKTICALCLEHHEDKPHWQSPMNEAAWACQRCINQSARILQKDVESNWKSPTE